VPTIFVHSIFLPLPPKKMSTTKSSLFERISSCSLLLGALSIYVLLFSIKTYFTLPAPSDEMFYIDAAWKIYRGTYTPPTPSFPYHHYLRWPVILPLSFLFRIIGVSHLSYWMYALFWHFVIAALLYAICRPRVPVCSSLVVSTAPFLVPVDFLSPQILSEPPACACILLSCLLLTRPARGFSWQKSLLAGSAMALAISSTMVALFFVHVPLLCSFFVREDEKSDSKARFIAASLYLCGLAGCYFLIMAVEGFLFGDPLIQFKVLDWWHFRMRLHTGGFMKWLTDYHEPATFVLGFTLQIISSHLTWVCFLILTSAIALFQRQEAVDGAHDRLRPHTFWLLGSAAFVALELFSSLAVEKQYLRFASVPALLLTAGALFAVAEAAHRVDRTSWRIFVLLPAAVCLWLLSSQNIGKLVVDKDTNEYYQPASLIISDLSKTDPALLENGRVLIVTEVTQLPGLIWYGLAFQVYSHYKLVNAVFVAGTPEPAQIEKADRIYYVQSGSLAPDATSLQWTALPYDRSFGPPCPPVFVGQPFSGRL
jgi:hypothetical protein